MSDNTFYSDDPTDKMPPRQPSQPDQQGKLIIGGFQNSSRRPNRRPYQFPPQPPLPEQRVEQPMAYPQRQSVPPYQNQAQSARPVMPVSPGVQGAPGHPYPQPGQTPGAVPPTPGLPPKKIKRPLMRRRGCLISLLVTLVLLIVFVSFAVITLQKVLAFGSAISTQKNALSTQTGYMGTSDRVNILVLGFGGSGHDGAYLTDSMMVMSLLPQSHHTTLISIPRDLWVQVPDNSGNYAKINAVYPYYSNNDANPVVGGDAAARKVSAITGLDIKYWVTINFAGFRDFINAIGGVDVNVPDAFNACYPKNDDASIDASWIEVQFNKGLQHMDGERAIEYARAREPLEVCGKGTSENQAELTDFARSARQQLIIKAALSKIKSIGTWPHLYSALNALQKTIYSNLSLADLTEFALKMDLNTGHRVGLSNQNVLVDAVSSDGQDILLPANDNWQAIKDYVQKQLYN